MKSKSGQFVHIADLDNAIQAQVISGMLTESDIPHRIISHEDPAYGSIFQLQHGWGYIESCEQHREEITTLLKELQENPPR